MPGARTEGLMCKDQFSVVLQISKLGRLEEVRRKKGDVDMC
jgi:hypothetical protein